MVVKSQDGYVMYRLPDGTMVKGVMIFDQDGNPVVISGGGGGGAVSINQGGQPVSSTNALFVRDVIIQDAVQNNGADTTGSAQMVMAGGQNDAGWAAFMPIGRDSQGKQSNYIPIGGHNGTNGFGWHVNAQGQGKVINDSLGDPTDTVATTDTGTWSIPSLLKKLNQSLTSLLGRFGTLGQKTMSGSTPVVIASDQSVLPVSASSLPLPTGASTSALQTTANTSLNNIDTKIPAQVNSKLPVQTDERPSASAGAITPSDSIGFGATSRGIYVGVGGDIVCIVNGLTVTFKNAMTGSIIPIQATRVNATGTTATNLIVLF